MIIFEFFFLHRVAKEVEKIVKNNGAIPATIAVISGKIHVGGCDLIFCCAFFFFFFFFFLERLAFKVNCSPEKNREELWFHLRLQFSKPFNWCFMLFNFKQTFFYYIVANCRLFCIKKLKRRKNVHRFVRSKLREVSSGCWCCKDIQERFALCYQQGDVDISIFHYFISNYSS